MSTGIFSTTVGASSLSEQPQWKNAEIHKISLSGINIDISLPGNYSHEFENILPESKNLYDESLYTEGKSFVLMDLYWHYKNRKILWLDTLGALHSIIIIQKSDGNSNSNIADSVDFKNIIINNLRDALEIPAESKTASSGISLPEKYESIDIKNHKWLKYVVSGGTSNADMLSYSTPLTEKHYMTVIFSVIGHEDYAVKNWYSICQQDIENIINSVDIKFPTSK